MGSQLPQRPTGGLLVSWGCWYLPGGVKMTCNKFLQNRPKKRNPTQKQPTDSPLFFLFFFLGAPWSWGCRGLDQVQEDPGLQGGRPGLPFALFFPRFRAEPVVLFYRVSYVSGKEQWSSQVSANGPSPAICAAGLRKFDAPHSPSL